MIGCFYFALVHGKWLHSRRRQLPMNNVMTRFGENSHDKIANKLYIIDGGYQVQSITTNTHRMHLVVSSCDMFTVTPNLEA